LLSDVHQARCAHIFSNLDESRTGFLEGEELVKLITQSMPSSFLKERLGMDDVVSLALAFDEDLDGKIGLDDFQLFTLWVAAMQYHGFFDGVAPLAQIADLRPLSDGGPAERLLLVSEFLDPEFTLRSCTLPSVRCVYYHPDGLTIDEFIAQLESAANIRRRKGYPFKSLALANHGPDDEGRWYVCSDFPVNLVSTEHAWRRLMPMFHALASMVGGASGCGRVDLLACNFAARAAGVDCIKMIEREVEVRFAASTGPTGNVACGGNWVLEEGGNDISGVYFDAARLGAFKKTMGMTLTSNVNSKELRKKLESHHDQDHESGWLPESMRPSIKQCEEEFDAAVASGQLGDQTDGAEFGRPKKSRPRDCARRQMIQDCSDKRQRQRRALRGCGVAGQFHEKAECSSLAQGAATKASPRSKAASSASPKKGSRHGHDNATGSTESPPHSQRGEVSGDCTRSVSAATVLSAADRLERQKRREREDVEARGDNWNQWTHVIEKERAYGVAVL